MQTKVKRTLAAIAALGALALGGAAIAGAANGGADGSSATMEQSEASEGPENQAAEGPESSEGPENQAAEGPEGAEGAEDGDQQEGELTGPDADKAAAAAERATGGKATEVSADNTESEQDEDADDRGGAQEGFQSPTNAAYEVEVDKGGKQIDVYLDADYQVLDTQSGGQDE